MKWLQQLDPSSIHSTCLPLAEVTAKLLLLVHDVNEIPLWVNVLSHIKPPMPQKVVSSALCQILGELILGTHRQRHAPVIQTLSTGSGLEHSFNTGLQLVLEYTLETADLDLFPQLYNFVTEECHSTAQFSMISKHLQEKLPSFVKVSGVALRHVFSNVIPL